MEFFFFFPCEMYIKIINKRSFFFLEKKKWNRTLVRGFPSLLKFHVMNDIDAEPPAATGSDQVTNPGLQISIEHGSSLNPSSFKPQASSFNLVLLLPVWLLNFFFFCKLYEQ